MILEQNSEQNRKNLYGGLLGGIRVLASLSWSIILRFPIILHFICLCHFIEFRLLFPRHGLSPLPAFLGKFSKIDRGLQVFLLMSLSAYLHKEGISRHLALWFLGITFSHLD